MILFKHVKLVPNLNLIEVGPVKSDHGKGVKRWTFEARCVWFDDVDLNNPHSLDPVVDTKREAVALRRDFIALLRKHGWKEERKSKHA